MKFQGIMPALVTPLTQDGQLQKDAVAALLDYLLLQKADGFYICGGTGEGLVMNEETRREMAECCADHLKGKAPCIAHIAAISLSETKRLAKHAESVGCDAVAAIPPSYFSYTQDDVYNYYKAISDCVHIPLMIYYSPSASPMSAAFIRRLFDIEQIRAVKWSQPDYNQMLTLKDMLQGDVNILNGPDDMLLCGLSMGADGGIGTSYNFLLPTYKAIYEAFAKGNMKEAQKQQMLATRIVNVLLKWQVIPSTKLIMRHLGFDVGEATYPMRRYNGKESVSLLEEMRCAGLRI